MYSPKKPDNPFRGVRASDDPRSQQNLLFQSPKKSPAKKDRAVIEAKKIFTQKKHEIAENFLEELDNALTAGKIFEMASLTGGIKIVWTKKLNTTAGRANWKRETIKDQGV